jgi:arginine repressor
MSGLKGSLDDCYEAAEKLRYELNGAVLSTNAGDNTILTLSEMADEADDLASRIDNLRSALRS